MQKKQPAELPAIMALQCKYQYKKVTIFEEKEIGRGSYGKVCQGLCDELPCAAKLLDIMLFRFKEGSAEENAKKFVFEQVCQILLCMHHPCIVQYMDAYVHPQTGQGIFIMELLDDTLTNFVRVRNPVPFHIQIDLCSDVIQALAYLHSNGIIHRNLTGSNVLVFASGRAKVTDFGMMRLIDSLKKVTSSSVQILSPDSSPYMPPEAFRHPSSFSPHFDIFSFGVLSLQVMTGQFPQPDSIDASEIERRKTDITSLDHPMLPVTLSCLKDRDILRPTATQIWRKFKQLQEMFMYEESHAKTAEAMHMMDAMRAELREVHKKNDELLAKLGSFRYENEQLIQLISTQTENGAKIGLPYTEPDEFIDIDEASLVNGNSEQQMDLSAPHPALWYHGNITRDAACMRLQKKAKPGAYLVRMSESDPGSYVLSFLDRQLRVFNYKISCKNGEYNASGQSKKWFLSLQDLIGYYTRHSTVKQNQHLDFPVPPPKVVPLPSS